MTPDTLFDFYDYVHSFYGKDGIYPHNERTIPQIADRERVRDIMNFNLGDIYQERRVG